MRLTDSSILLVAILVYVVGVLIEVFLARLYFSLKGHHLKEYHFSFGRYLFMLLFPILSALILIFFGGKSLIFVFLVSIVIGPVFEWVAGFGYHKIVGQRLWTYHRYDVDGYTSLLSVIPWGLFGVLFWIIAKLFV